LWIIALPFPPSQGCQRFVVGRDEEGKKERNAQEREEDIYINRPQDEEANEMEPESLEGKTQARGGKDLFNIYYAPHL